MAGGRCRRRGREDAPTATNLGLLMRHLTGVGTPRSLQGRAAALVEALIGLLSGCWGRLRRFWAPERHDRPDSSWGGPATRQYGHAILD